MINDPISGYDYRTIAEAATGTTDDGDAASFFMKEAAHFAKKAAGYREALKTVSDKLGLFYSVPVDDTAGEDALCEALKLTQDALAEDATTALALEESARTLIALLHGANAHWWVDPATGEDLRNNPLIVPTKLMLAVSELAEAMEGDRKSLPDDKLPHRAMLEVEIADHVIRLFDLAGAKRMPLHEALVAIVRLPRQAVGMAMAMRTVLELTHGLSLDVPGAIAEKNEFNAVRPDHKADARTSKNGKAY